MNRKQKLKLLEEVIKGKRKISELDPKIKITFYETIINKDGSTGLEEESVMVDRDLFAGR